MEQLLQWLEANIVIAIIIAIINAIIWFLVPFYVFSIHTELKKLNKKLEILLIKKDIKEDEVVKEKEML